MRQVLSGTGVDTTSTVKAYLASSNKFILANLFFIGDHEDPQAIRLTDWESPLAWPIWGTFNPAKISRGSIDSQIGLSVKDLQVAWTPMNQAPGSTLMTANPYQLAQMGFFDNKFLRCFTAYMPTPGDVNTYGAALMFGGRISSAETKRGQITFKVNSFLDVVNEMVPLNVIELTSTAAGFSGGTPPAGCATIPQFNVITSSSPGTIIGDQTSPNVHGIFANNQLAGGFLVFNGGAGATLGRRFARIAANYGIVVASVKYNEFILYDAFPWAPTPGTDTFYVCAASSINSGQLANAVLNAAGSGYTVGDVLTITGGGGSGATVQVMAVGGGGAIAAAQIIFGGTGYVATTAAAVTGGTGTGATFNLTLPNQTQGFPFVPQPNAAL